MKNPDTYEIDPEDIFEELDPTEPDSLDARIRAGDEIDADELEDEDWESLENYVEHLDEKKPISRNYRSKRGPRIPRTTKDKGTAPRATLCMSGCATIAYLHCKSRDESRIHATRERPENGP